MIAALWHIWRASLRRADPLLKEIMIFTAGFLVMAATANLLSVYVVFWILFGIGIQLSTAAPAARTRW